MVTRMLFGRTSIVILDKEAFFSLGQELAYLEIAVQVVSEVFVFANQVEFQGLVIPRRMPLGCTSDPLLISQP